MTGPAAGPTKIAVVGAGSVGATLAYACLIRGVARTIALYDVDAAKTRAETLDLNHGLQFVPMATVIGSDDIEVCRGADLVVVTAGAKQKPGQTRLELAAADIVRRVVGAAEEVIRGKGATNYAVGLAATQIIEAVLRDQRQVLPVSSLLEDHRGISDVCLSVPSVVDRDGVETVLPVRLSEEEAEGLRRSADTVRGVIGALGL